MSSSMKAPARRGGSLTERCTHRQTRTANAATPMLKMITPSGQIGQIGVRHR
jgi:hypothetical protein